MRRWEYPTLLAVLVFTFLCLGSGNAYAYIDPGTGSYLFQIAMAGLLAGTFVLRAFWGRLKTAVRGIFMPQDRAGERDS